MNRASLDRGFGRCMVLRKYAAALKQYSNRTAVSGAWATGVEAQST